MADSYDEAVAELYQGPHATFVAERKRLAAELKEAGDKSGSSKLGKLPRPPISAWTVNQLWWQAREEFEAMLESAAALRDGDLGGAAAHRETIAKLRQRASAILTEAGNAATEATLRRVTTTLSAIAATGGFDPDPPGALGDDRDPPGFEALGIGAALAAVAPSRAAEKPKAKAAAKADDDEDDEAADKKRREQVELRNKADQLCYGVEKALSDLKDKLPADKVSEMERKVASLREALDKEDYEAIKTRSEELNKAMEGIAAQAYQAAGGGAPGAAPPGGGKAPGGSKPKGDDDVIDAEFEETN